MVETTKKGLFNTKKVLIFFGGGAGTLLGRKTSGHLLSIQFYLMYFHSIYFILESDSFH